MASTGLASPFSFGVFERDASPFSAAFTLVTLSLGFCAHFFGDVTGGFINGFRCQIAGRSANCGLSD